jgi:exonuclease III
MFLWGCLVALVAFVASQPTDRSLSVVTWNVNGIRKFRCLPTEVSYLANHDVVLIQETFSRDDTDLFEIRGFYSHHQRALPGSGGRNIWGLSTFFKTSSFTDGLWVKVFSPTEWILMSRLKKNGVPGLLVLNVYIPVHTAGFLATDVLLLRTTIDDLLVQYPGDIFVVGGDFNIDVFDTTRPTSRMIM